MNGKNGRYVPVFGSRPAVYQSACDHKLTQGSETNARPTLDCPNPHHRGRRGLPLGATDDGARTGHHAGQQRARRGGRRRSHRHGSGNRRGAVGFLAGSGRAHRRGGPPGPECARQLRGQAWRYPVGHRQGISTRSVVLARDLAGQPADTKSPPHLPRGYFAAGVHRRPAAYHAATRHDGARQ